MKRLFSYLIALALFGLGGLQCVNAAEPMEAEIEDWYERIQPPQPIAVDGKVEVTEVFWYGCSHCYSFLPFVERWLAKKPAYAEFRLIPAVFRESWLPHAKAFYTAELLGVLDELHVPLFQAIHIKKRKLDSKDALMDFFAEYGVSKEEFGKTYDSFAVASRVRRAKQMTRHYGVHGVPAMIINGKYRTSGSLAGSYGNAIKVVEVLVEKEHEAMMAER